MQEPITRQLIIEQLDARAILSRFDSLEKRINELSIIISSKESTDREYITRGEAAKLLRVSVVTIDNYSDEGIITRYGVGGLPRWIKQEVLDAPVPMIRRNAKNKKQ